MSAEDFFDVVGRPSFPFFVQGRDLWKKSNFRCFSKTRNLSKIQDFWQNECTRFFRRRRLSFSSSSSSSSSVVADVGRRRRRASIISLFRPREGPLKKIKFSLVFQKLAIFLKFKIFGKMSARDFFAVADRRFRRRRSSSSSVVADVGRRRRRASIISLFRPREGPLKKIKFSMFFKNSQSF